MKKSIAVLLSIFIISFLYANGFDDLNGYWNEEEVQKISSSVVKEITSSPKISNFEEKNERLPFVSIGKIQNEGTEKVDVSSFEKILKNCLIDSNFMTNNEEDAADFTLNGTVRSHVSSGKKYSTRTYYVIVQIVDIESDKVIFSTEEKFSKRYKTPIFKF